MGRIDKIPGAEFRGRISGGVDDAVRPDLLGNLGGGFEVALRG